MGRGGGGRLGLGVPDRRSLRPPHRDRTDRGATGRPGRTIGLDPFRLTGRHLRSTRSAAPSPRGRSGEGGPHGDRGMAGLRPPRLEQRGVRRVVIVMPSLFTLANLFFGIWSIVLSSREDFYRAGWYIVIAGVLDVLDGLFARMSN